MRIVALGGAGAMGRRAARTAAGFDFVEELVVADLDGHTAGEVAHSCGPKARGAALDVTDDRALARILASADVVLNTVGPFFRFGAPMLRAAIAAKTHYLDINDDWEPTLEMLELDAAARDANVTAILGMGASPGVSNLLAAKAAAELDEVHQLTTGWGATEDMGADEFGGPEPSAAIIHWMHQISGTIRVLRDGQPADVKPIEEVCIEFPGIGEGRAWTVGHPEAVTLPRTFTTLRDCVNVMVMPAPIIDVLRQLASEIDSGRMSEQEAARMLVSDPVSPEMLVNLTRELRLPPLFAFARGRRQGRGCSVGATVLGMPAGGMAGATGVPLAVALQLFAGGAITRHGVFAPEAVVDADAFFDALAPQCVPAFSGASDLVAISTTD